MSVWLQTVLHAYARLAPRERLLLQVAIGATVLVMLYGMLSWFQSAKADFRAKIAAKQEQLVQIQSLRKTYLQLQKQAESRATSSGARPENFSLFSFLDGVGKKAVSREKILAMSPSSKTIGDQYVEESVEMKLGAVSLDQMVELLYEIENAPTPLGVSRLQMKKRYNDPFNFDVTLVVTGVTAA